MELSSLSTEYIELPVTYEVAGVSVDPRGDVAKFAFTSPGVDPVSGDWIVGSWETGAGPWPPYLARVLVGPNGGHALAKGPYDIWWWVADNPEQPIRHVGFLRVT